MGWAQQHTKFNACLKLMVPFFSSKLEMTIERIKYMGMGMGFMFQNLFLCDVISSTNVPSSNIKCNAAGAGLQFAF